MNESEAQSYQIVVNDEEQYSIWPADRELPAGWKGIGFSGGKRSCLDRIADVWTDMRPRSLREYLVDRPTRPIQDPHPGLPALVSRLSAGEHRVELRLSKGEELDAAIARHRVRLFFPETLGGTEMTVPASRFSQTIRAAGELTLDYERIRCEAVIELPSLAGWAKVWRLTEHRGLGDESVRTGRIPACPGPGGDLGF